MNILNKFRSGLIKTSNFLTANIAQSITSKKINPAIIDDIETVLISADIGLDVTNHLINKIKTTKVNDHIDSSLNLKSFFLGYIRVSLFLKGNEGWFLNYIQTLGQLVFHFLQGYFSHSWVFL